MDSDGDDNQDLVPIALDYTKLDPINQRRQTEQINQFILNTVHFFNTFSAQVESKFQKLETNLQRIDADFAIMDSKVEISCKEFLTKIATFSFVLLLDINHWVFWMYQLRLRPLKLLLQQQHHHHLLVEQYLHLLRHHLVEHHHRHLLHHQNRRRSKILERKNTVKC